MMHYISPATVRYRQATEADFEKTAQLLHACQLPATGLSPAQQQFLLAEAGDRLVGCAAIEQYGSYGLFRSLAVAPGFRNLHIAATLLEKTIRQSRENGIVTLFLLTTTAPDYFRKKGWTETERNKVPEPIGRSDEFKSVCPASALCMMLTIA